MPAAAERWLSLGVAVVCVAEAGLRVWAFGVWRSPDAYLRNPWNWLDGATGLAMLVEALTSDETYGFQVPRARARALARVC